MKTLVLTILGVLFLQSAAAQDVTPYALTKEGATIQYSYSLCGKLMGYNVVSVKGVSETDGKPRIQYLSQYLNKKGKPIAMYGDGFIYFITIEDGGYYFTQDLGMGFGGEDRNGYMLKMPAALKVGDTIEGGTLMYVFKFMGQSIDNELTCHDFKVVEEVDLTTPAGTFHCLKITGTITGSYQNMKVDDHQIWYLAPGIGIVRQEMYYMGAKKPYVAELIKTENL